MNENSSSTWPSGMRREEACPPFLASNPLHWTLLGSLVEAHLQDRTTVSLAFTRYLNKTTGYQPLGLMTSEGMKSDPLTPVYLLNRIYIICPLFQTSRSLISFL